ncbi:hypothetical protein FB451DRAFT_719813 [Mycena latifolia]|nr:hypothetical protein FB451DRAFT_719813 [Mycena latifolia]
MVSFPPHYFIKIAGNMNSLLCEFTFLVLYHDEEVSPASSALPETTDNGPSDTPRPRTPDNSETSDGNVAVPSTPRSPVASEGATKPMDFASLVPEQPIDDPISERAPEPSFSYQPVSPAIQASGVSVPKHVQVIRRRKPFKNTVEDKQTGLIDAADDSVTTATHTPPNYYLEVLHKLYIWVLFGLPDHYSRTAPHPPSLAGHEDGAIQRLYRRWMIEWIVIGIVALLLFCILLLRRASSDLIVWILVRLSTICLFFGTIYAIILFLTFEKLGTTIDGLDWIRQVPRPPNNPLWNPWIMLSMPAAWILWGVTYFAFFLLAYLWRSGPAEEKYKDSTPSLKQEYGPRFTATFIFVLGVIYLGLMIRDVKRLGSDSGAQSNVPDTLLREVSNVVLRDLPDLLRAGQIIIGQIINNNISGGVGGPGGGTGHGTQVEVHIGRNIHGVGSPGDIGGSGDEGDADTMPGGYFGNISGGTGGAGGAGSDVGGTGGTGGGTTIHVSP